ncbi:hypothetical protein [Faecalibacter sp. LW9]|uniref:hypothetical protein n=1 Tax=Faecalibacter sp. LW9 TaxID=3103144 RepID=UPI002AFEF5E0|nr:hypothetical protein [Faecalibacter sp. LW9]
MRNDFIRKIALIFLFMFGLNLGYGQHPSMQRMEEENQNYLVTKIQINEEVLETSFIRLSDSMQFKILPQFSQTYYFNLEAISKKGLLKVLFLDENGKVKLEETITTKMHYSEDYAIALEEKHNYYLVLKGKKFKGKVKLTWKQ